MNPSDRKLGQYTFNKPRIKSIFCSHFHSNLKKNRLRIFSLLKFKLNLFSLYLGFQNLRERTISFPTWIWMKGLRLNFEAISSNCVTFSSLENVKGDKKELISLTRFKSFYTSGFLMFAWTIEKSSEMKRVIYT